MLRFDRMTLDQAAALAGESKVATSMWLRNHGYTVNEGVISRPPTANDREDAAWWLRASAPHSRPCVRCGAARACAHRGALAA